MKKLTLVLICFGASALTNARADFIYGVNKEHQFDQTGNATTVERSPDAYRFNAFIAGSGQSASIPSTTIFITTPLAANHSLAFNTENNQWEFEANFGNQTAMDALYPNGTYGFTVGGNTGFITVAGELYPNTPYGIASGGTWFNGTLYVTPGANVTISSNVFTTNYIAGQSRIAVQAFSQNGGPDFEFDSLNDAIPLSVNTGNITILGSALMSGNIYDIDVEFNAFSQMQNPGIDGGTNVGLYTAATHFTIVAGSPVPEPAEYALLAGVAGLGASIWRRRREKKA